MSKGPAKTIADITKGFAKHQYICSEQISTAVYLANEFFKRVYCFLSFKKKILVISYNYCFSFIWNFNST